MIRVPRILTPCFCLGCFLFFLLRRNVPQDRLYVLHEEGLLVRVKRRVLLIIVAAPCIGPFSGSCCLSNECVEQSVQLLDQAAVNELDD